MGRCCEGLSTQGIGASSASYLDLHADTKKPHKSRTEFPRTVTPASSRLVRQRTSFCEDPHRVASTSRCLRNDVWLLSLCVDLKLVEGQCSAESPRWITASCCELIPIFDL